MKRTEVLLPQTFESTAVTDRALYFREHILAESANRANPIFRNLFPRRAGRDAVVRIADLRVIHIAARAFIFRHDMQFLRLFTID